MPVRMPLALALAASATFASVTSATAQVPQAIYPLQTDTQDVLGSYADVSLLGTPPPATPSNGVCVNGVYLFAATGNGQDVRTPVITSLDTNDFQVDFEFQIAALPASSGPVLMGGNLWRWIGIYLQSSGTVGVRYNNGLTSWTASVLTTGQWYAASLRYEAGDVELHLDGALVHQATIGALVTGNNLNFTTNDFSIARNFDGCIRNLLIANDTTLQVAASAASYGAGCDGLGLAANGLPSLGNNSFALVVQNVPVAVPLGLLAFGSTVIDPGADLTPIGMAGCAAYMSLDLGLYGPVAAVGGDATFALPIPNTPSLAGALLAAQGVAFSSATSLGLSSSNGVRLTVGF